MIVPYEKIVALHKKRNIFRKEQEKHLFSFQTSNNFI